MTTYEREVIKRIRPLLDAGKRGWMMRVYQNLTTKRHKNGRCKICGGELHRCKNQYCSNWCANHAPRRHIHANHFRKITKEQVEQIRVRYIRGHNSHDRGNSESLAKEFHISRDYLVHIAVGRCPKPQTHGLVHV